MKGLIILGTCAVGVFLLLNAVREDFKPTFQPNQKPLGAPPKRIVSCTFFADEILMALADADRIQAVTFVSDLEEYCSMHLVARKIPHRVRSIRDVERIIELRPDLVVVDLFNSPSAALLLEEAGLPLLKIDYPRSIQQVEENISRLGKVLEAQDKAIELLSAIERSKECKSRAQERLRVLYFLGPTCPTRGTLLHDIIKAGGGLNMTSSEGDGKFIQLPLERLIELDPDVIFVGGSHLPDVLKHVAANSLKARKTGRIHLVSPKYLESASHMIVEAIDEIAGYLDGKK